MKGRPEKNIDWEKVDKLLIAGCIGTEIAAQFDMHPHTFYDRVFAEKGMLFTDYQQEKRDKGNSLLRAKQFEKALEKDNTMLIWLGKQRLGQKEDPSDQSVTTNKLVQTLLDEIMQMKQKVAQETIKINIKESNDNKEIV